MLSLLLLIPLVGALSLALWPGNPSPGRMRTVALVVLGLQLIWSLLVLLRFDTGLSGMQLQESFVWVGSIGLDYRLGGCCSPLPGEQILGAVALGNHGITIHRQDCSNVLQAPVERRLPVRWNPLADGARRRYPVQLRIEVLDRVGVLKDILTRLSDHRINVSDARVRTNPGKPARIDLRVELASASQLGTTMDQIRAMADVLDIARTGIG